MLCTGLCSPTPGEIRGGFHVILAHLTAVYLSMVMLDYEDTFYPGRARERIPMRALAVSGRMRSGANRD